MVRNISMSPEYIIFNLEDYIDVTSYSLKVIFIGICTYYTFIKLTNMKGSSKSRNLAINTCTIISALICTFIRYKLDYFYSILCLICLLSSLYSIMNKNKIGYTTMATIISLSINYILFFI